MIAVFYFYTRHVATIKTTKKANYVKLLNCRKLCSFIFFPIEQESSNTQNTFFDVENIGTYYYYYILIPLKCNQVLVAVNFYVESFLNKLHVQIKQLLK